MYAKVLLKAVPIRDFLRNYGVGIDFPEDPQNQGWTMAVAAVFIGEAPPSLSSFITTWTAQVVGLKLVKGFDMNLLVERKGLEKLYREIMKK